MGKDGSKLIGWIFRIFKKWALTFSVGFVFALLCFVTINAAIKPTSKSTFCANLCHEMDTAYQSWKLSVHSANEKGLRAECVDCHAPSKDDYFSYLAFKAYAGGRDMYKHYFGDEYNVEEFREKVLAHISNKKCISCHIDLLARPGSDMAKEAHTESLMSTDESGTRCVECHEDVGHQR